VGMPSTMPRSVVRLLAVVILVTAVVAVVLLVRARQPSESKPSPAARALSQPTPATIPYSSGAGYPEGAVALPEASSSAPPAQSRPRLTVPLDAWSGIVDRFGSPRGPGLAHGGIDFGFSVPESSPVYTACGGVVMFAGYNDSYGLHAVVDCGEGWSTVYAYLDQLYILSSEPLTADTVLGLSDASGRPLHFEVRWQDIPQDPEVYLDLRSPRPHPPTITPTVTQATSPPRPTQTARPPRSTVSSATATPGSPTTVSTNQPRPTPTRIATPTPVDKR